MKAHPNEKQILGQAMDNRVYINVFIVCDRLLCLVVQILLDISPKKDIEVIMFLDITVD